MSKWSSSDTGILRKKKQKEKHEDLLVFGYACKLFRDDEKALYIDQGKHLIPWMGNESLRIDRYDGRGALSELVPYESSKEGYDAIRWLGLSESERKLELLCDEERYYALHTNEDDENMYKEEETKRNQQKHKEFQYNYDVAPNPENEQPTATVEEEDKPFTPLPELDVPADIDIPKTVKENARIEKTAIFVSVQGPQMEILIKAKQSDNPQFSFMNQSDPLFKYYRHILTAIKSGRYKIPDKNQTENHVEEKEQDSHEDHYLHPSLLTSSSLSLGRTIPPAPQINYKPSADCAYSQLVNRIQGNQTENTTKAAAPATTTAPGNGNQLSYEQQQYYQYYYTMQYYEYYNQMAQYQGQNFAQGDKENPQQLQEQFNKLTYAQFMKQQNPYAQIVTNISQNKEAETTINDDNNITNPDIAKAPVIYGPSEIEANFIGPHKPEVLPEPIEAQEVKTIKSLQIKSLVHYDSDSEEEEEPVDVSPPTEIQVIIDKMASYVSKNGPDFESSVKSKGDARFEFLNPTHEFHAYYKKKISEYLGENSSPTIKEEVKKEILPNEKDIVQKVREKKIITPVSFSIKKPKEHDVPKEIKSALPIEESDEDEIENAEASTTPTLRANSEETSEKDSPKLENKETNKPNGVIDVDDPILEMIDLTDDTEEKRDARRAEDRIKDKLAAAAREKLASASRDRALQLERKKKAAAFLKLKSVETDGQKEEVEIRSISRLDDKVHTISDSDNSKDESEKPASKRTEKKDRQKDYATTDNTESRRHRKSSKKRKSHKRRSKSKHDYRHKKSKKRRRRSESHSSNCSASS